MKGFPDEAGASNFGDLFMRSPLALLPLAACFVFATVDNADARAGKGFRGLFGSSTSSAKSSPSGSATSSPSPNRGAPYGSQAASAYRDRDQRFPIYGSVGYRPQSANQSSEYRSEPSSPQPAPARAVKAPAPAPAPVAAALVPSTPPVAAAKAPASENRPVVERKNYRDPNPADVCPPPAYVFDNLNGCRAKGAQVSNLR
jgi:hypothetical protein